MTLFRSLYEEKTSLLLKKWIVQPESANEQDNMEVGTFPAANAIFLSESTFSFKMVSISQWSIDANNA